MPAYTAEEAYLRSTKACLWTFIIGACATVAAFILLTPIGGLIVGGITWFFWNSAGQASTIAKERLPDDHPYRKMG